MSKNTQFDITESMRLRKFSYPIDVDKGTPFIFLGAYKFQPLTDARQYHEKVFDLTNRKYEYSFSLYVPQSLKFNYNPQVGEVSARIGEGFMKNVNSIFSGGDANMSDLIKGGLQYGLNNFILDSTEQQGGVINRIFDALKSYRELSTGKIFDPKQLQMVRDTNFLNFNLNYKFLPENNTEMIYTYTMVELLRYLSAPKNNGADVLKLIGEWVDKMVEKITDKESRQAMTDFLGDGIRIDTWDHPHIWDMYLITPNPSNNDNTITINDDDTITIDNTNEFSLFKPAKALIIDGLSIDLLQGHDREDTPFYVDGMPLGFNVDISFKSITKYSL